MSLGFIIRKSKCNLVQGINTIFIVQLKISHDPEGVFIKKMVTELADIPVNLIHEPWKLNPIEQQF
jgi:deoxyribodipyrimidine photo-lyase